MVQPSAGELILRRFLEEEKNLREERNVYLAFAHELALLWLAIVDCKIAQTLLPIQEQLIREEVSRAWQGRVEFDRKRGEAIAISPDGLRFDLILGQPEQGA